MNKTTLTKDEVFSLMCKAFEAGYRKAAFVEAGLESLDTEIECAWMLSKYNNPLKDNTAATKKIKDTYTQEEVVGLLEDLFYCSQQPHDGFYVQYDSLEDWIKENVK